MRYTVYWSQAAVDDLAGVFLKRPRDAQKVVLSVRTFGRDGRGDLRKLNGPTDEWRLRAGDWRVILTLEGDHAWISQVDNRRDVY